MEDLTGQQLGPYRIVTPLGEGGMAAVFKAYQPGVDRYVALKILPRHLAGDLKFSKRFQQEARTIANLQHINILPVHDYGQDQGYTYIVMPYVETGTLADLLQGGPLPLARAQQVMAQIGSALDYAHARDVVHRDIKPSNILVDEGGNCLLTDFGISKILTASSTQLTATGDVIGTPAYMSPEQGLGEELDRRSDIYSLGVVLYEMVTGRQPYRAETPMAVIIKHIHDPLPLPRSLNPKLPEAVERVVLKALAKEKEHRYQTAGELSTALQTAVRQPVEQPTVAASPGSLETLVASTPRYAQEQEALTVPEHAGMSLPQAIPSTSPVTPKARPRLPWWAWAGLAVILVAISLGIWAVSKISSASTPAVYPVVLASLTQTIPATTTPTLAATPLPPPSNTPAVPQAATPILPAEIQAQIQGTLYPPAEAVFSALEFTNQGLDALYRPVAPAETFQNPVGEMYAAFSYDGLPAGVQWTALWYRGQVLVHYQTEPWQGGTGGMGFIEWRPDPQDWLPGEYQVQLFLGLTWQQSGAFRVVGDPLPPTLPATATPSRTPPPAAPQLLLSVNSFCRGGPGVEFDQIWTFYSGDRLDIVGKDGDWWLVKFSDPGTRHDQCWIAADNGTATGDLASVPYSNYRTEK